MIRLHHLFDSALHMSSRVHFDPISITIPRNPEETLIAGKVMGVGSKQKPPTEMLQRFHRLPCREVTYPLPAWWDMFTYPGVVFLKKNPGTFFCCWCFRGQDVYIPKRCVVQKPSVQKSWFADSDGPRSHRRWWRLDKVKLPHVQRRNQPHPHRTTTSFQSMVATLKATVMDFFFVDSMFEVDEG